MSGHDSETDDSDIDSSMIAWINTTSTPAYLELREAVTAAIQLLQKVQLTDIAANSEDLHRELLRASNAIHKYLDGLIANHPGAVQALDLFALLVRPPFLEALFAQRKLFHGLAVHALPPGTNASTIVCWVDAHLAKMAEVTLVVACGRSQEQDVSDTLRMQLEDDGLRAAAQLPEKWSLVPAIVGSPNASPAAKRLATQLTYAVYIFGPHLRKSNPWIDYDTPSATDLLRILEQYILATVAKSILYSTQSLIDQTRLTYALIVSLYAVSDSELRRNRTFSPLRPRTLGCLLDMMELVLHPGAFETDELCIAPCEHLDSAQIVLLRLANSSWCWETWNDYRVAGTECIIQLTATWLYHLHVSRPFLYQDVPYARFIVELNPPATNYAIGHILHHSVQALIAAKPVEGLPASFFVVLTNACCIIDDLLRNQLAHGRAFGDATATTTHLFSLFVLLGDRLELKSTVLESLTLIDEMAFDKALMNVSDDKVIQFGERLDEMILQLRKLIHSTESSNDLSSDNAEELRLAMNFLILIWHSAEGQKLVQRQSILNLFSSLTNRLLRGDLEARFSNHLRVTIVTGFSVFETDPTIPIRSPKQEDIWRLALDSGASNLFVTSSFAHYVMTVQRFLDPLSCVEACDHLRDTLTLILRGHFTGDERPIAVLVSLVICGALVHILDAGLQAVNFTLTSPWTMSLCAELKTFIRSEAESADSYSRLLKRQLASISDVLLNAIHSKLDHDETPSMKEAIPKFKSQLVYYGRYPDYSLVLVPHLLE